MNNLDLPAAHSRLATTAPLIQNITNTVTQQFSANVLLAIGASPAMIDHEADAAQFATVTDGILINFGTASSHQYLASDAAIQVARTADKPWVLDPVSVGVVDYRSSRIHQAARQKPAVIRGNASEIAALAGVGLGGRGTDSTAEVDSVLPAAVQLARATGSVIAISGFRDAIVTIDIDTDTVWIARVDGGHAFMPRVIGTGCSLGSATAAYVAAGRASDHCSQLIRDFEATVAAHVHFAVAGEIAGKNARGPGTYAAHFLDALYALKPEDMDSASVNVSSHQFTSFAPETAKCR